MSQSGPAEVDVAGIPLVADLGRQLLAPHDRPGHEVREEREVDRQVDRAGQRELRAGRRRSRS